MPNNVDFQKYRALRQLLAISATGASLGGLARLLPAGYSLLFERPPEDPVSTTQRIPWPNKPPLPKVASVADWVGSAKDWLSQAGQSVQARLPSMTDVASHLPDITTTKPLGDWWGPAAAMTAATVPAWLTYKGVGALLDKERAATNRREAEQERRKFEELLTQQYREMMQGKSAAAEAINQLHTVELVEAASTAPDCPEKSASSDNVVDAIGTQTYGRLLAGMSGAQPHDAWRSLLGWSLATALGLGGIGAATGYGLGRKQDSKEIIDKALQERARLRKLPPAMVEIPYATA